MAGNPVSTLFSTPPSFTGGDALAESGKLYATMNSPFSIGGGVKESPNFNLLIPWLVVGGVVIAWVITGAK